MSQSPSIVITYDPLTLPEPHYRAGLAGLLVLIDTMRRRKIAHAPKFQFVNAQCHITLTEEGLVAIFNELFDAHYLEKDYPKPFKKANVVVPPLRTEQKTTKDGKTHNVYIYPVLTPKAAFLENGLHMPEPWANLWRNVFFNYIHKHFKARTVFARRADGQSSGLGEVLWKELLLSRDKRADGKLHELHMTGNLLLGCYAESPEGIKTTCLAENKLLLYFWPIVSSPYRLKNLDLQKKENQNCYKAVENGRAVVVPDVINPEAFLACFKEYAQNVLLQHLQADQQAQTEDDTPATTALFYPRDSVISMPEEATLAYGHFFLDVIAQKAKELKINHEDIVQEIEIYHLQTGAHGYELTAIVYPHMHHNPQAMTHYNTAMRCRSLAMRQHVIRNLLNNRYWYEGFQQLVQNDPVRGILKENQYQAEYLYQDIGVFLDEETRSERQQQAVRNIQPEDIEEVPIIPCEQ